MEKSWVLDYEVDRTRYFSNLRKFVFWPYQPTRKIHLIRRPLHFRIYTLRFIVLKKIRFSPMFLISLVKKKFNKLRHTKLKVFEWLRLTYCKFPSKIGRVCFTGKRKGPIKRHVKEFGHRFLEFWGGRGFLRGKKTDNLRISRRKGRKSKRNRKSQLMKKGIRVSWQIQRQRVNQVGWNMILIKVYVVREYFKIQETHVKRLS